MRKVQFPFKATEDYIPIVRVTGNYQVTIPASVRKALQVNIGDFIEVTLNEEGGASIKPVEIIERNSRPKSEGSESKAWARTGEESMLSQYDNKDSAYDQMKL